MIHKVKNKQARARLIRLEHMRTRNLLSNNYCVFEPITCESGVVLFGKHGKPAPLTQRFADSIGCIDSKWTITLFIMVREKVGKNKLVSKPVDIHTPCKHSDIAEYISEAHIEWIKEFPVPDTVLTVGWIAGALGNEPTTEEAYNIFGYLGVWHELKAPWEIT